MSKKETQVAVFDTSIASGNLGDDIIMDGVMQAIGQVFPTKRVIHLPSHERIGVTGISSVRGSECALVGGSNLLSAGMWRYPQWRVGLAEAAAIRGRCVLLGVGWRKYDGEPSRYTKALLTTLLSPDHLHSVRDSYTAGRLHEMGFKNVINTACPTLWELDGRDAPATPRQEAVVFTLTAYAKHRERDIALMRVLAELYSEVFYWPQGRGDEDYIESLGEISPKISTLPPTLASYDKLLADGSCDYVGTRLHGGIRAMQHGRHSLILAVDNRAIEMGRDVGLNVSTAADEASLREAIERRVSMKVSLPTAEINRWKAQFQ
jgi:polysaccharide pyruvyl transferase WcaK-like protein